MKKILIQGWPCLTIYWFTHCYRGNHLGLQSWQSLSSLPYTNVTGSFNPTSPLLLLYQNCQPQPNYHWPGQLETRNERCTTSLQCCSSSLLWTPLLFSRCSVYALLQLPFCTQARNDLGGSVGTSCESHSREQLCVGVCQEPAMKAQIAAEFPPTSLLRSYIQPILFV